MQASVLRRRYLPHEPETLETLAAAIWLHRDHYKQMSNAVQNGIFNAFNG